jgi:TonB-dependent starch-binding outer membrane protein SusC
MRKFVSTTFVFLLCIMQVFAQERTVTGKVTDESGAPIPNASVIVKGTSIGTTTKTDGSFSISVPSTGKVLIFSSIGMTSMEVNIGSKSVINQTMTSENKALEEVVITGYSTVSKTKLTGSYSKVDGKQVENRPVLSFDQALTGKASGVQINTSSGLVGDNVIIRIRGAASISSGSQPLIVMDGVPLLQGNNGQLYNPANVLADINPNDIESVEILKDAAATSIYGSRASAGVLLITTKKGKAGKTSFTYDNFFGYNTPANNIEVLNGGDYTTVMNKLRSNAGLSNIAVTGDLDQDGTPDNTNWQDEVYRNGFTQSHQVSMSGGADRTSFYGSLSYNDFKNYIIVNGQTRGSVRLNMKTKVTNWFDVGINSQYSRTRSFGLGSGTGGALSGVPFGPLTAYPNVPAYNKDGSYFIGAGGNTNLNNTPNPVAVQNLNNDTRDSRRFIGSAFAEATIFPGLKFKSQYNIDYLTAYTDQYWDASVGDGSSLAGLSQTVYNEDRVWAWFNTLNYNKKFGSHDIGVLAGAEYTRQNGSGNYAFGIGLRDPLFRIISASNFNSVGATNFASVNRGLASYFSGVNYSFKNKYLATFNFRADANSDFGKENRWGYFPSGSVGWKISDEKFWSSKWFVNDLKLRASYGVTGNSNIGNFASLATFATSQYADLPALNLNNPGNTNLRWEKTIQTDIGVDFAMWNKVNVTIDYYQKKTKDLILANPVLSTLGFPGNSLTENIGQIENKGVELSIGARLFERSKFSWDINFNGAWNKNKVTATNSAGNDIAGGFGLARPGYDLGAFYLIRWAGVNPVNGLPTFLDVNGVRKQYDQSIATAANRWTVVSTGAVTTAISAADRKLDSSKTPYPKFYGGITQNIRYQNFDLSVDLQYALGFYVYNSTMATLLAYTQNRNKSVDILNAWSKPGDVTDVPRLFWNDNQWNQSSTRWLEKGDFLRIRNIQIGYSLPRSILTKAGFSKLRIYAQVQNAFTITNYKGADPEANANGNTNIGLGVDNFRPYLARTITFGLNLGF